MSFEKNSKQEQVEDVKLGFKRLVDSLMFKINSRIESAKKIQEEQAEYRSKYKREEHHFSVYDLEDVVTSYFALVGLQTQGIVSQAEISPLQQQLEEIIKYEDKRSEGRADNYSGDDPETKEKRRQMILKGKDATLTKSMVSYFESNDKK